LKVSIGMKYVGATIAAIDDMIAMLSDRSPCSSRHGGRSALSEGCRTCYVRFYAEGGRAVKENTTSDATKYQHYTKMNPAGLLW
jgi:hypothetical protein